MSEETRALLDELTNHGIPNNPYGTFSDALVNLSKVLMERNEPGWAEWLLSKAASIRTTIAKVQE